MLVGQAESQVKRNQHIVTHFLHQLQTRTPPCLLVCDSWVSDCKLLKWQGGKLVSMSVCRYRETIAKELSRICKLPTTPVWRQAKDMLKEEGIALALDAPQAPEPAKADADVQVGLAP